MNMEKLGKYSPYLLIASVVLYVISPVDAMPGPVDDILAILAPIAAKKLIGITGKKKNNLTEIL